MSVVSGMMCTVYDVLSVVARCLLFDVGCPLVGACSVWLLCAVCCCLLLAVV